MTTYASTNLIFLNGLETKVSHELEKKFNALQSAASEHLETLKKVLEAVEEGPINLSSAVVTSNALPNAAGIVWSGVAETLVRTCLDQILVHTEESESERFLNREEIVSKWRRVHSDGMLEEQLGLSADDLGIALRMTVKLLGKRETWMGAPELKRDGRLYRVESSDENELRITSRPLVS